MRLYMAQTWLARKLARYQRRRLLKAARESEFAMCGKTVHALHRKAGAAWDWV
jgi:hypothetical protein